MSSTWAVLVTSNSGKDDIKTSVGSSVVFPSLSSPSSLISFTLSVNPGLLAITLTEL